MVSSGKVTGGVNGTGMNGDGRRAIAVERERAAEIDVGVQSHTGLVRTVNEDGYLVHDGIGLYVVADGMGGHQDGKFASETVIRDLAGIGTPASAADLLERFERSILSANAAIRAHAVRNGGGHVGTTVAALLIHGTSFAVVWCGDSRIYRIRDGRPELLTHDHTEVQQLLDSGVLSREEAKTWPRGHILTRAIGAEDTPELDLDTGEIAPGDVFVLCSDGLTAHVEDGELAHLANGSDAQASCDGLVETVLSRGARDNVTVVVVRVRAVRGRTEAPSLRPTA